MRILVLTFYFRPDLSAGSFRATALVDVLAEQGGDEIEIDVFTTLPNRYNSFSVNALSEELKGNIRIRRFKIPSHHSGVLDQSIAFSSYAYQVINALRGRRYDLVFATSSRLMTASLGAIVSKYLSVPLYLDIRDIFTDTVQDLLAGGVVRYIMPVFKVMERFTMRSATKINIVSEGFKDHFQLMVPEQCISIFTNGIDEDFLGVSFANPEPNPRPVILYAGNIGQGQGIHRIVPDAARRLDGEAEFLIVGDGGARKELEHILLQNNINNVKLQLPVHRLELIELYRRSDFLFLHLNNHDVFQKVLPSKIFEYAATGKPILAGVKGYAREFIMANVTNAVVFDPCDFEGLVQGIRVLQSGLTPREDFIRRFSRTNITRVTAQDILSLLPK